MSTKIKSIKPLAETKYLSLYDAEYINRKGSTRHWTIASRKDIATLNAQLVSKGSVSIDAVIIAAIHKTTNRLVLVKQFRIPVNDYIYELPAGLIDKNEDVMSAVRRELHEETGLELVYLDNTKSLDPIYVSGGMTDESVAMAYCLVEGNASSKYLEDDEDLEVIMVSTEEAALLLTSNAKFDIKAYLVIHSFISLGNKIINI